MFDNNNKEGLSMGILREEIKQQRDNMREWWRLYEELREKVNGLFKKDLHDTERPKVDIFEDRYEYERLAYFDNHNKIYDRITELEKKK